MFIELKEITKKYGSSGNYTQVLKGIDLSADKGEICVILGPSGSGKSTLLNIIGGLEEADNGSAKIGEYEIIGASEKTLRKYRRDSLGYVFQFYNLVPNLTVKENIEVCKYLTNEPLDIDELLNILGLTEHQNKFPNQLSGGQQQRTALARALVKNPNVLFCDEPTGALDYNTSKEILTLIESVNKRFNTTIIIVTHNQSIQEMANRVIKLHDGKVVLNQVNENRKCAKDLEW